MHAGLGLDYNKLSGAVEASFAETLKLSQKIKKSSRQARDLRVSHFQIFMKNAETYADHPSYQHTPNIILRNWLSMMKMAICHYRD
jgi:hypothetical protein